MDPLSILGAVSAVMGIVDVGSKVVSTSISRYNQTQELAREQNAFLTDTTDIKERAQILRDSLEKDETLKGLTPAHQTKLRKLCEDSVLVTEDLLYHLLKWSASASRHTGVVGSVKAVISPHASARQIKRLRTKLQDLQTRSCELLILILK
jgi:hypothetical protein